MFVVTHARLHLKIISVDTLVFLIISCNGGCTVRIESLTENWRCCGDEDYLIDT